MSKAFVATCFCAVAAWGQGTGRITGSVTDPTGAAVPKANVSVVLHGGTSAAAQTSTSSDGLYAIEALRPVYYDLVVEAPGFQKFTVENVKVDPARSTDLAAAKLELATASSSVDVTATAEALQTASTDVSVTITADQIHRLPVADRNPLAFVGLTQAGAAYSQAETAINGQRSSFTNVTLDGINIQDNYIRTGGLDYTPAQLTLLDIEEVTLTTSNQGAAAGGGASQISFSTPSGGNTIKGEAFWQNRNAGLAANNWFNNQDGLPLGRLNLNQMGGRVAGPIKHDKLFYSIGYEAYRMRTNTAEDQTILTANARQGIFSYLDTSGALHSGNVLTLMSKQQDPLMAALLAQVPTPDKINNYRVGDSQPGRLMNTAGYSFNVRSNEDRDAVISRLDYDISAKHSVEMQYRWNRDTIDRPDIGIGYSSTPEFKNDDARHFASSSWRWNPRPSLTNELRGGFYLAPATFGATDPLPQYMIGNTIYSSPDPFAGTLAASGVLNQGRTTNTYALSDNATWIHGKHTIDFGYDFEGVTVRTYDYTGTVPVYDIGTDSSGLQRQLLTAAKLPGIASSDLANANLLLATLGGYLNDSNVTHNVASRTSGFIPGYPYLRHFNYQNHAFFGQDHWQAAKGLTVTLGLRWDYTSPVDESNALVLQPQLVNGDARATLLSDATLNFTGSAVGRPLYNKDLNNFAPTIGLAWDPFHNGKTVLRGGYGISYVNDEAIQVAETTLFQNGGLQDFVYLYNLSGTVSANRDPMNPSTFQVPLKFSSDYQNNTAAYFGMIDPGLRTPYVQQWQFGVQHEFKGAIIEARYVGEHGTKLLRAFDYNQNDYVSNGFLADFLRAESNGNLALAATGTFNPAYNSKIAGSQPLTVFPKLQSGGYISGRQADSSYIALIQQGEVGELAYQYQVNGIQGSLNFYPNPNALSSLFVTNFSNSTHNALQLEVRRRIANGLSFQANYVYSKTLSDAAGTDQTRFEPFLDINNPGLERSRTPTDIPHQFKANFVYELPFGGMHKIRGGTLNPVIRGWSMSGVGMWQSGNPFSLSSERGTFLREDFSQTTNMASTSLTASQLANIVAFRMTGNGPYEIASSALGADGRGVAPDSSAPFTGQVFFNPGAGSVGTLQRRYFTGPNVFNLDTALVKQIAVKERIKADLRLEALNVFNHPTFAMFRESVNSYQFGKITSTAFSPRRLQLDLRISF